MRTLIAILMLAVLAGCSPGPNQGLSTRQIKERYARMLVDGVAHKMQTVRAQRVDPETLELFDLRIEDSDRIIHADRAEILVSTELNTVSLRLYGVVDANVEEGSVIALEGMTTEPVPLD